MGYFHRAVLIALLICLQSACATGRSEQRTPGPAEPASLSVPDAGNSFDTGLELIRQGKVEQLLALRNEPLNARAAAYLQDLYTKYGGVKSVETLSVNRFNGVARGLFVAMHERGPFLWDIVVDNGEYSMIRGSQDLVPLLVPAAPPQGAIQEAERAAEFLRQGRADQLVQRIICRCVDPQSFARQVTDLAAAAGPESGRRFSGAQSLPGLENRLAVIHFVSERAQAKIGVHLLMWNVDGTWRINSINWGTEDLIPRGAISPANRVPLRPSGSRTSDSLPRWPGKVGMG